MESPLLAQEIQFNGEKASIAVPWKVASNTSMVNGFPEENREEEAKLQKYYDELPDLESEGHPAQLLNFRWLNACRSLFAC